MSNGLGSGKTDYRLSAKVGRDWDQLSVEGEAGYAIIGNPGTITVNGTNQTLNYRNALFTSASLDYKFNDSLKIGSLVERQESIETGSAASMTLGVNANLQLMKSLKLNGELYTGLTSNSPDIGAGVSISKTF